MDPFFEGFQDELVKLSGDDWENLKYILKHKYHIYKGGREIGVPRWQLLKHDLSKLSPTEWGPYKRYFFGKKRGDPAHKKEWRHAVEHSHYKKNPHHPQYWSRRKMPMKYKLEMMADWYSSGRTQKTHRFKSFRSWWKKNRSNPDIDAATRSEVDRRLKGL